MVNLKLTDQTTTSAAAPSNSRSSSSISDMSAAAPSGSGGPASTNHHPVPVKPASTSSQNSSQSSTSSSNHGHHHHHHHPNRAPSGPGGQHHYRPHHGQGPPKHHHPGGQYHLPAQQSGSNNYHHYLGHGGGQQRPAPNPHHSSHHVNHNPAQVPAPNQTEASPAPAIDLKLFESIEYPFCTELSTKYEPIAKIGQGTFGEVHKARCKNTQEYVALKKVLTDNEKEGFPITALREIKILQVLRHENIVRLIEICTAKASAANKYKSQFYLVFEFCEHDLAGLLSNQAVRFTLGEQKKIMQQLLNGLYFIHKNLILHRDMKTANILVTKEGKLKLADFGLARATVQSEQSTTRYTNRVVTLWYRPPELLLGERCYNKAIDIWGSGCIMAELWTREPILKGNSEQNQLDLIQSLCGSITPQVWPDVEKLDLFNKMHLKPDLKRRVRERLGTQVQDQGALDLLERLLTLDPKKRIDSDEALDHDFFWTDPLPTDLKLEKHNTSMFEYTSQNLKRGGGGAGGGGPHFRPGQRNAIGNDQHHDRVY